MTFFISVLRLLGPAGCAALLALAYYEGVPGINRLTIIEQIPFIREFGVGRVELERREAVADISRRGDAAALSARLAQERAKRVAAEAMATEARNRATAALRAKEDQAARTEEMIADALRTAGLTYPTEEDLRWLENSH